jgi:hypothetical protein
MWSRQELPMDDTQHTPNTSKPAAKPQQYTAPPAKAARADAKPEAEQADRPAAKAGRATAAKEDQPAPRLKAVTITIDPESAEVVRVEGLDDAGARHELSDDERASLAAQARRDGRLEELLEHAFEAGIACVLGEAEEDEATEESPAEEQLRHLILAPLMRRSVMRRLTERAALNRAVLGSLIERSRGTTVH